MNTYDELLDANYTLHLNPIVYNVYCLKLYDIYQLIKYLL